MIRDYNTYKNSKSRNNGNKNNPLIGLISFIAFFSLFGIILLSNNPIGNEVRERTNMSYYIGEKQKDYSTYKENKKDNEVKNDENNYYMAQDVYANQNHIETQNDNVNFPISPIQNENNQQNNSSNISNENNQSSNSATMNNNTTTKTINSSNSFATSNDGVPQQNNPTNISNTPSQTSNTQVEEPQLSNEDSRWNEIITTPPPRDKYTTTPYIEVMPTQQPKVNTETYTINEDAYNNASTIANSNVAITNNILSEINSERSLLGLANVSLDETLSNMAGYRAYDMAKNNYFSHSKDGTNQLRVVMYAYGRLTTMHYENLGNVYGVGADNLPSTIMEGWRQSQSHYSVIKSSDVSKIGIAIAQASTGRWYVCTIYSN